MTLNLTPGLVTYLGASFSPGRVLITSVGEGGRFTYRDYPYQGRDRAGASIERSLITTALRNMRRNLTGHDYPWVPAALAKIDALLAGDAVSVRSAAEEIAAHEPVTFTLRALLPHTAEHYPERGGDPWYAAEAFGGVAGRDGCYVVDGYRYALDAARADGRFEVVSVSARVLEAA